MLSLILTVAMIPTQPAPKTAQFQSCVWPHKCVETPAQTAQFQTCVWPNKCVTAPAVAQFEACVWPKTCAVAKA